LRWNGEASPVNCFEDLIAAAFEQRRASLIPQPLRIITVARIAQDFRAVRVGDDRLQVQLAISLFGKCADWHLAPSTQPVQQRALTGRGRSGVRIIEEGQQFPSFVIAFADLDT
jgi:hypothetical protein